MTPAPPEKAIAAAFGSVGILPEKARNVLAEFRLRRADRHLPLRPRSLFSLGAIQPEIELAYDPGQTGIHIKLRGNSSNAVDLPSLIVRVVA